MLLSITIDTTHPDAQGDARTAIELLANTFIMQGDLRRVLGPNFQSQGAPDDVSARGVAAAHAAVERDTDCFAMPLPPNYPQAKARTATPETLITPDLMQGFKDASDSARQMDAALGARVIPGVVPGDRKMLIPGTDTYVPVDINGLPWDKRIHASTQAFVADGSWRRKPKVSDEDFKRISDEMHVVMTAPEAPVLTVAAMTAAEAFAQPAPQSEGPKTFIEFMTWIGGHSHAQRLTLTNVSDVMAELGLVNAEGRGAVALIDKRPDLIPAAYARLSALLPAGEG